jgi:hypothetical protein
MANKADPIIDEGTAINLAGKQYTMRRLSVRDVLRFSGIVNQALSKVDVAKILAAGQTDDALSHLSMSFMAGLIDSGDKFAGFYGSIIGLSAEEFLELPAEALGEFLEELPKQQDMQAFFAATAKYLAAMGTLWQNV